MMMPRTSICNKETRARIENLRPSELLVAKTALIMLKFTPITLQRKRREGGHQRKIWNVDETLSKASVLQRRGHQRKTWNVGVFKPTSPITNFQKQSAREIVLWYLKYYQRVNYLRVLSISFGKMKADFSNTRFGLNPMKRAISTPAYRA